MLAGNDFVAMPSISAMAKGKGSAHSARIAPVFQESDKSPWRSEADLQVPQELDALPPGFVVGYALKKKKVESFIQPKLLIETKRKGISLVPIDRTIPLCEQGPFHVILHKLSGKEWRQELEDYKHKYPSAIVLDPPESIQQLRNRQSMLQAVENADLRRCGGKVGVPRQLVVTGDPESIPSLVHKAGLKFPLVVKPLVADGTAKSHAMYLAYHERCLSEVDPPLVLQEFVNHGGVLFKVYVVGDAVKVVRRLSLPDVCEGEEQNDGLTSFARISSAAAASALEEDEASEPPPDDLLLDLATELRERLGLHLFNIDLIREKGTKDGYYVIDINYFPGYGKMPDYEVVFSEFLLRLAENRIRKQCGEAPRAPQPISRPSLHPSPYSTPSSELAGGS